MSQVDESQLLISAPQVDQQTLKGWIDQLADAYHNNQSLVSDATFDRLVDVYESRFEKYTAVGAMPHQQKVDLPYPLPSLDKMVEQTKVDKWLQQYPGPYVLEDKLDGLTGLYVTRLVNGVRQTNLYTRGDGWIGRDISHILPYLNLPQINGDFTIRGEIAFDLADFEQLKIQEGKDHDNPRNLVSGTVGAKNSFDPNRASKLKFYAYRIMESNDPPETQILTLMQTGFNVPWATVSPTLSFDQLTQINQQRKGSAPYDIDGIVVYQNRPIDYPESHPPGHPKPPKNAVAFKMETPTSQTTIREVIWESSKEKLIKPVLVYDPVKLSGATLTRASGYNAKHVIENQLGPGAVVLVTRSGDVIPKIIQVIQPSTEIPWPDPAVHGEYDWNENGVELVAKADNRQSLAGKLKSFLDKLEVDNVGPVRVQAMVDSGIDSIYKLITATPGDFVKIDRIGEKLAAQIYSDIQAKIQNVSLAKVMAGSGIFPNVGERRFQAILDVRPDFLDLANCDQQQIIEIIQSIPGFKELAITIAAQLSTFVEWLNQHSMIKPKLTKPVSNTCPTSAVISSSGQGSLLTVDTSQPDIPQNLTGMTIVFSGFRDNKLKDEIEERGGKVTTSVSRNTKLLLMKDVSDIKGKAQKALDLGIPLISIDDFRTQYLN